MKKMLLKKCCFLICAFFLFQSLYDTCKEYQSVQFIKKEDNNMILNFSFCIEINEELLKNFQNSNITYQFTVEKLVKSTCYKYYSNKTCYNLIDLRLSYLFNYHSCLVFKSKDFDQLIRKLVNTSFYIFAFPNYSSEIYFHENVFVHVSTQLSPFTLSIRYVEYHRLEAPFETNCHNYSNKKLNFDTEENVVTTSACIYECIKTKSRSLNYYYSIRDDKQLFVHKDDLKSFKEIGELKYNNKNLTISLQKKCSKECKRSCKFRVILVNQFKGTKQKKFNIIYNTAIYSAKPKITKVQTIINFISLIVLFLNISFYETIPFLIKKILLNYFKKYIVPFMEYYWILRIIIFILCLLIVIVLSLFRIFDYLDNDFDKLISYNFPTEISPFYLMICVPVQILIDNHSILDEEKEISLLITKSFAELENLTDFNVFKSKLERIYIQYASIEKEFDYIIDRKKTVFKYFDYELENNVTTKFLLRCYKLDLNMKELRYEMLYSFSKLKIILKFNWYVIYPIPKDFNITSESDNLIFNPYIVKVIHEKKINCFYYSMNKSFINFSEYKNGIDQCVNEEHLKNYSVLTIQSVIYKDTIPLEYKLDQVYFNRSIDKNILKGCEKKFKIYNCWSQYFLIKKQKPINQINETFSMNLYFIELVTFENIIFSMSDLLLNNLLSFESIFIGLNIGKILSISFILLKRYKLSRILKYFNYFKFIILLIGLSLHIYYIIYDILNSDYILETDYIIFESFQLPNLIFCFEIQNYNEIDFNHKITLKYMDDFTKNLNLSFFQTVLFLDNNFTDILISPYQNKSVENLVEIHSIYFLNLKCFEFVIKSIYYYRYIYILNSQNFVRFKFNRKIMSEYFNSYNFNFYFISRKKITNELNGIEKININYYHYHSIQIHQKSSVMKIEEKFTFIHNPLYIVYDLINLNDSREYFHKLIDGFSKLNFRTTRIIMNSKELDYGKKYESLEIDNEMFDQYFYQIKNFTDSNSFKILNYERNNLITNILQRNSKNDKNHYDVKFYLNYICGKYTSTNRDNYSKFIISILNCLNFWLNFCCFDFYVYLKMLCNLIYKFYQIVLSFKFYLKQKRSQTLMQNL